MNGETTSLIVDTDLETKTFAPVRLRWMSRAKRSRELTLPRFGVCEYATVRLHQDILYCRAVDSSLTHLSLRPPIPPASAPSVTSPYHAPILLVVLHQTGRSWWWHIHHLEKSLWVALSDNEVILLLSYLLETFVIFLSNVYILTYMQTLRYRSVQGAKKLFTAWLTAYVISCTDTV